MSTASTEKSAAFARIAAINQVEGFDPMALAVEYNDLNTGEKRLRLPVMALMAWFRLTYPEGKISVTATPVKDHYIGHARVYHHYNDPEGCYLAEATASRRYDPEKPNVSPREWAQTAAVGVALRNAGFGLQFHAAGEPFDQPAVDELVAIPVTGALEESRLPDTHTGMYNSIISQTGAKHDLLIDEEHINAVMENKRTTLPERTTFCTSLENSKSICARIRLFSLAAARCCSGSIWRNPRWCLTPSLNWIPRQTL